MGALSAYESSRGAILATVTIAVILAVYLLMLIYTVGVGDTGASFRTRALGGWALCDRVAHAYGAGTVAICFRVLVLACPSAIAATGRRRARRLPRKSTTFPPTTFGADRTGAPPRLPRSGS